MKNKNQAPYRGFYNPNRVNALDSGLVYFITLAMFIIVPKILLLFTRNVFRQVYQYDTYAYLILNTLLSQLIIFFVAFIYSRIRRVNPFSGGGYVARADGVQIMMSVILIMGIMMTFFYTHMRFGEDAETIVGSSFDIELNTSAFSGFYALTYLVLVALVPAIVEEMLFRGIIMRGLEQFGQVAAVVCSAVAFALMHGNFSQLILQFLGGLAIGGVVMITRNWIIGSVMHFFNNFFSTVYGILISEELITSLVGLYVNKVVDAACIVIGVVCLVVSLIYFGSLAFKAYSDKVRNFARKEPIIYKPIYYLAANEFDAENVRTVSALEQVELLPRRVNDDRLFSVGGKMRKANKKSAFTPSVIVFGISVVFAVVTLFL